MHHRPFLIADGLLVAADLLSPGLLHFWDVIFITTHILSNASSRVPCSQLFNTFCSSVGTRLSYGPEDTRSSQQGPKSKYTPSSKRKICRQINIYTCYEVSVIFKGCCAHAQRDGFDKMYKPALFFGLKVFKTEPLTQLYCKEGVLLD